VCAVAVAKQAALRPAPVSRAAILVATYASEGQSLRRGVLTRVRPSHLSRRNPGYG